MQVRKTKPGRLTLQTAGSPRSLQGSDEESDGRESEWDPESQLITVSDAGGLVIQTDVIEHQMMDKWEEVKLGRLRRCTDCVASSYL